MAILFFDSSAVVKRYVAEAGSQWIIHLASPAAGNDMANGSRLFTCQRTTKTPIE